MHGGCNKETYSKLGKKGLWSIKTRMNVGLKVGCYKTADSSNPRYTRDKYHCQCAHGTKSPAGNSRKSAIAHAKRSDKWCSRCEARKAEMLEDSN